MSKKTYRSFFLFLVGFVMGTSLLAQTFSIEADKDSITIGDPITLTISLNTKNQEHLIWPTFFKGDSLPETFEILEVLDKQQSNNQSSLVTQQLTITSFDPGLHLIEPLVVQDSASILTSNTLSIYVSLFPADTIQPIRDIKPILEAELTSKDKWYGFVNWLKKNWYWIILGLIVLGFLIWLLFFRKKKKVIEEEPKVKAVKPKIPPHILALQDLRQLNEVKPWKEGGFKEYNSQLTDIMRTYIFGRYKVSTKEKTSAEILDKLRDQRITNQLKESLNNILTQADLVKFAKQEPTDDENQVMLDEAINFVKQTTPASE